MRIRGQHAYRETQQPTKKRVSEVDYSEAYEMPQDPFGDGLPIIDPEPDPLAGIMGGVATEDRPDPVMAVAFLLSMANIAANNPVAVPPQCREDAFRGFLRALEAIGVPIPVMMMANVMVEQAVRRMGEPPHHFGPPE